FIAVKRYRWQNGQQSSAKRGERTDPLLKSAIEFTPETAAAPEVNGLRRLSARLGRDPRLVQASNGNTSVKRDGTLWIKASGRWLANAMREDSIGRGDYFAERRNIEAAAFNRNPDARRPAASRGNPCPLH